MSTSGPPLRLAAALLAAALGTSEAHASATVLAPQDATSDAPSESLERLPARVTTLTDRTVYLDLGREAGVRVGDRVELRPSSGPLLRATVRSVARASLRAELDVPATTLRVGDRAEVLVPAARLAEPAPPTGGDSPQDPTTDAPPPDEPPPEPGPDLPERPPWELDLSGVPSDAPLLAPIEAVEPSERDVLVAGRAWFDFGHTIDDQGTGARIARARLGLDAAITNAFGQGGELELDVEGFTRSFDPDGGASETDDGARLKRLSYRVGGDRSARTSWQVGRFLSDGMSEFGLIDGVEWQRRTSGGNRWGLQLGALPVPSDDLDSGDDVAIGVFHRWVSGPTEALSIDTGYQKSWHEGDADRDLVVVNTTWLPATGWFVFGSAWVDVYTSEDDLKSSGPELTQLVGTATWRSAAGNGIGATVSHNKLPQLLRDEFDAVTAAEIADVEVTRGSVYAWREVAEDVEVRGRVDAWEDQEDSGGRVELGTTVRDWAFDDGSVELAVFQDENKFSSGPGLRLGAQKSTGAGWLRLVYETARTENTGFVGTQETLVRDLVRASWDTTLGSVWDLSLNVERRGGDVEDALSVGLYIQRRF